MSFADAWLNQLEERIPTTPLTVEMRYDLSESAIEDYPKLIDVIRKLRKENGKLRAQRGVVKCDCGLQQATVVCANCHEIITISEPAPMKGFMTRVWSYRSRFLATVMFFTAPVALVAAMSMAGLALPITYKTYLMALLVTSVFNPNSPIRGFK